MNLTPTRHDKKVTSVSFDLSLYEKLCVNNIVVGKLVRSLLKTYIEEYEKALKANDKTYKQLEETKKNTTKLIKKQAKLDALAELNKKSKPKKK